MKKLNLTIGIPVYNESANIVPLLQSVLRQHLSSVVLKNVIISNDGSTDNSSTLIRSVRDRRIKLISNPTRKGIARGLNQIIAGTQSEILVLLDADILLSGNNFIEKLVSPVVLHQADLTSSDISPLPPENFINDVLSVGMQLKYIVFNSYKHGNNLYTCHGLARALSKRFYHQLFFSAGTGNDMYTYLRCRELGYAFRCVKSAVARFRLPANFRDHFRQNTRYFHSPSLQIHRFAPELLHSEFHIPASVIVSCFPRLAVIVLAHPFSAMVYVACVVYAKIYSLLSGRQDNVWLISESSKNLSNV